MDLYLYEQVTFELFDYLESELGFVKSFNRIAYESNIVYSKESLKIRFLYEIGWSHTLVVIEQKTRFRTIAKSVIFDSNYVISDFGNQWLSQNPQSRTNQIVLGEIFTLDYELESIKSEVKKLLFFRENIFMITNDFKKTRHLTRRIQNWNLIG